MRKTVSLLGSTGIIQDGMDEELPENAWTNGRNVRFRNGFAERFGGHDSVFGTPSVTPYWLQPYSKSDGTKFWIYAGLLAVYVNDGTTGTDITGPTLTATSANKFTGGVLAGNAIMNTQADVPQFWNGDTATNFAALTGWDANHRCKSIRPYRNYLVAMNITKTGVNSPHMVKVSDASNPGSVPTTWTPANTNDAEERDLAETQGVGVDSLSLGDVQICYKADSYYGLQFVGGDLVFRTYLISDKYGMLSQNCGAQYPGGHIVLGIGDVYTHSGGPPTPILEGRMREWLFSSIDTDNRDKCFIVTNPRKDEAWICYPDIGQTVCTSALVWNWRGDTFSVRDLPNVLHGNTGQVALTGLDTWDSDTDPWSSDATLWDTSDFSQAEMRLLFASSDTLIFIMDQAWDYNGVLTTVCYLERQGLSWGDPWALKTLKSIFLRIDAPTETVFSITFGSQQQATGSIAWQPPITYTQGTSLKADGFSTGRFNAIRVSCSEAVPWRFKSYDVEIEMRGMY